MQAFILAGGFATRLWPLTEKRAKPLLPLAGKSLLTWLVGKIPEGIPITVSTNAVFAKDFETWRSDVLRLRPAGSAQHDTLEILIEDAGHEDEKLGALGAVAKWIKENSVQDGVLLLAGDNYVGFSLEAFIKEFRGNPLLAAFDIRDEEQAKQLGTVVAEGRKVTAFEEKPSRPRSTLVSTGCVVLPASSLAAVTAFAKEKPDNIGGIFEHFLKTGTRVECVAFSEPWFDIGSFEAYLEATKTLVGENVLKVDDVELRNHVASPTTTIPQYTSILKTASHGTEAMRKNGNVFTGSVVLGGGSKVRKSRLHNVVLFENCKIEDCVLEDCIIDDHCVLKGVDLTGKMLRAGTRLLRS